MQVPVGPATILGYGTALVSAVIAGLEALNASGQAPGSVKWLAILSAALVALTNFNRSIQAAKTPAEPVEVPEPPASALDSTPPAV